MAKPTGWGCFPLWLNDWRGSRARTQLSLAARAAYLELCTWLWTLNSPGVRGEQTGNTALPFDDPQLARYVGVSIEDWLAVKEEVLACFERRADGYHHPKVADEISYKLSKSRAGKLSGAKRRTKGGTKGEPSSSTSSSSSLDERSAFYVTSEEGQGGRDLVGRRLDPPSLPPSSESLESRSQELGPSSRQMGTSSRDAGWEDVC